jgi:hypothetical protein
MHRDLSRQEVEDAFDRLYGVVRAGAMEIVREHEATSAAPRGTPGTPS